MFLFPKLYVFKDSFFYCTYWERLIIQEKGKTKVMIVWSLKDILMAPCFSICFNQRFVVRYNIAGGGISQTWLRTAGFSPRLSTTPVLVCREESTNNTQRDKKF